MRTVLSQSCPTFAYANERNLDFGRRNNHGVWNNESRPNLVPSEVPHLPQIPERHLSELTIDNGFTPEGLTQKQIHMCKSKLKSSATTSQLLCGFAMTAAAELQTNSPEETDVPQWLWISYVLCTTLLVSVHAFAIMISTYILPNIDVVSKLHKSGIPSTSPHVKLKNFVELAWMLSSLFGLFLFLVELLLLCWVKFWDFSTTAAIASTVVVVPAITMFFLFAAHSYKFFLRQKVESSVYDCYQLETMRKKLDMIS